MADILFNKSGVPLIAYGKSYQATTTGTPAEKPKNHPLPDPDAEKNLQVTGKKKATTALCIKGFVFAYFYHARR